MKEKRLLVALGALSAALVACGSSSTSDNGDLPGGSTGGTTGAPGNPTGGVGPVGNAGTGNGPPILPDTGQCVPGIPVTTQIPRMMNRQYQNAVRDLLGVTQVDNKPVSEALIGDFTGAMTAPAWGLYKDTAAKIATQVISGPNKAKFISCEATDPACLKTTVETFGRKAFRRPMRAEEVTRFLALGTQTPAGTADQIAEAALTAFLISPSFLLIPELATDLEGSYIKLSQQEVATRLSFLIWGSVPDDALSAAADAGQLTSKDEILAQAKRMIGVREKAGGLIAQFHQEWAQMNNGSGHWFKHDHDPAIFPSYQQTAKATYLKELDAFFEEVAFSGGSFQDLLTSNVAYVNKDNAAIYGLDPQAYGAELTKVTLDNPAQPRPGFLTRAGFLSSYSNYTASSPILRGAYISVNLLAVNPGAPTPEAAMATVEGQFATQRAYVEALTQKMQPCKGCHDVLNPSGYVLESYDAIGRWQTTDLRGGPIDASVTTNVVDFGDGVKKEISSPVQLMQELAKMPKAQSRYARAWVSYAYGRNANDNDNCVVNDLQTKLAGTYTILDLVGDLTQADSFRLRVRGTP